MSDHRSATRIDLGVTDKIQRVGEFVNMESANSEDGLYLHLSHSGEELYSRPSNFILCGVIHWPRFRVGSNHF